MATAGTLIVRLMAKTDQFRKEMEESQKQLQKTAETSQGVSAAIAASLVAVGAAAVVAGGGAVKLAARLEQTQVAFTTLLGHAAAANAMIRDLQKFAAETPFEFPGLADAARQLIAFGIEAEKTIPTLRRIGDISAGIGAPIGEIAEIYGKARVQGRMFAEDVNQLAGRGIPIIGELAKQFGVAESEVRRLVESGQVHFKHLERAFVSLTGEGGKFAGLMKAQSETIAGLWSTLKDNVGLAATALGETIIKSLDLKGVIKNLINATDRVRTLFENFRDNIEAIGIGRALEQMFSPQIRLAVIGLAGAISGALVPSFIVLAGAIKKNVIALGPFVATGIVVAAVAYNLYDAWTRSSSAFDKATATALALATALIIMNKLGVIALIKSIPGTIVGLGLLF
ncbi:MAG: tape measure protein [Bacillota bacterium]